MLALLLMANSAAATTCAIFVIDEYKMTINNAKIYIDNSSQSIGTTAYNTGFGRHCWVGDINLNGTHTLSAKWVRANPNQISYEGSAIVDFGGETKKLISIPTHKA
jgi:hypothetical protein